MDLIHIITNILPTLTVLISVLSALLFLTRGRVKLEDFSLILNGLRRNGIESYRPKTMIVGASDRRLIMLCYVNIMRKDYRNHE